MDSDIIKIHSVLQDANLPSSINDLKNPTEEYVIRLITAFLREFHIDVDAINKPTLEQQDIMTYSGNLDIIGILNLYTAMAQICDRIYINDLCISDITSPGPKRIRKQAKFLANFVLYTNNKISDIQSQIDKIKSKGKELDDISNKREEILEEINKKALLNAKQQSLKEKYLTEIEKVRWRIKENNQGKLELDAKILDAQKRMQKSMEVCWSSKTEATELNKAVATLKTEDVQFPEKYETQLRELEEQYKLKQVEREIMRVDFHNKKCLIQEREGNLSFAQAQINKISEANNIYELLKKECMEIDHLKKQIDVLKANVDTLEAERLSMQEELSEDSDINEYRVRCKERLAPLRSMMADLTRKKRAAEVKVQEMQTRYGEIYLQTMGVENASAKIEEETSVFVKNCQDLYDNEMMTESSLHAIGKQGKFERKF
ncbi:hypothetical protein KM043_016799 [Ampulex compressa]|nr:hypothetical protein KM043_016799 [Ampulex compressa]